MVIAHHHKPLVGADVIDPVGDGLAQQGIREIVGIDPLRPALGLILPAAGIG